MESLNFEELERMFPFPSQNKINTYVVQLFVMRVDLFVHAVASLWSVQPTGFQTGFRGTLAFCPARICVAQQTVNTICSIPKILSS